jgi:hypothetical protein
MADRLNTDALSPREMFGHASVAGTNGKPRTFINIAGNGSPDDHLGPPAGWIRQETSSEASRDRWLQRGQSLWMLRYGIIAIAWPPYRRQGKSGLFFKISSRIDEDVPVPAVVYRSPEEGIEDSREPVSGKRQENPRRDWNFNGRRLVILRNVRLFRRSS